MAWRQTPAEKAAKRKEEQERLRQEAIEKRQEEAARRKAGAQKAFSLASGRSGEAQGRG